MIDTFTHTVSPEVIALLTRFNSVQPAQHAPFRTTT